MIIPRDIEIRHPLDILCGTLTMNVMNVAQLAEASESNEWVGHALSHISRGVTSTNLALRCYSSKSAVYNGYSTKRGRRSANQPAKRFK